ncbi:hypothetical protein [Lacinutrix jangbogonensis]|uniref:hypothetical protein n=1 Tax=Lacinutrix jangbogonensis TaxID=1469557 RepID=UPI00053E4F9F|nr:hypothetical protein [Lacinutrix jangbogonensis]
MGGGGVMAHAIHTMKANRKLVSKRKENRFSFVHTSTEKTEYNLPKSTPERLKRIQEKFTRENKVRKLKRLLLIGVFTVILMTTFVYIML